MVVSTSGRQKESDIKDTLYAELDNMRLKMLRPEMKRANIAPIEVECSVVKDDSDVKLLGNEPND